MKLTTEERASVKRIAASIDVPEAALLAVIETESNGIKGEVINGRLEPLIRYEGHYFDKLCDPKVREAARKAGVSDPKAGGVKNPVSQVNRWSMVKRAAAFDRVAAYASCSYGVGQVMGSHWKALGYISVDQMINAARSGFAGQVEIMAKFIKMNGLDKALRDLDWSAFARGYNGKNYRVNKYDTKMAAAYARWGGEGTVSQKRSGYLRLGSQGAGVRDLQAMLVLAGAKITIDGDFGTTTHDAVMLFQLTHNLVVDGIVGPKTQEALTAFRAVAPENAGQQKVLKIDEVQKGLGTAVAIPAVVNSAKETMEALVEQVSPYAYLSKVTEYLQTGIMVITVVTIVAGVGYAAYGWWKSKKSFTGTRADDEIQIVDTGEPEQLVLPAF